MNMSMWLINVLNSHIQYSIPEETFLDFMHMSYLNSKEKKKKAKTIIFMVLVYGFETTCSPNPMILRVAEEGAFQHTSTQHFTHY